MKYSDVVASLALVVSLGTLVANQLQNRATQVDATRPRLKLQVSMNNGGVVNADKGDTWMQFQVKETNFGVTQARDVRSIAMIVRTNSPYFALEQVRASSLCQFPGAGGVSTLYPGESHTELYHLGSRSAQTYINQANSFSHAGVDYMNSKLSGVVITCITYQMDGVSTPFTEALLYSIHAECGEPSAPCDIFATPSSAVPTKIELWDID